MNQGREFSRREFLAFGGALAVVRSPFHHLPWWRPKEVAIAGARFRIVRSKLKHQPSRRRYLLIHGDEQTAQMLRAGRALEALDLLPAPFPIEEILEKRELRHVQLLYGIGGLSYGNVSARYLGEQLRGMPDPDGPVYWMSASGVDKSKLDICAQKGLELMSAGKIVPDQSIVLTPQQAGALTDFVDEFWANPAEDAATGAKTFFGIFN